MPGQSNAVGLGAMQSDRTAGTSGDATGSGYVPGLDGLRAIAVLAVIAYHLRYGWASGGFLGVDLFFVLSGYLITSLLLRERLHTGRLALGNFYARRARRLYPAVALLLVAVVVYATWFAPADARHGLRWDALATVGYVANWRFVFAHQSYFAAFSAPSPLRHMWSLGVEEQFYLVWPWLLMALLWIARQKIGRTAVLVGALAAGSVALVVVLYHPGDDPSRVYYGTDTRAFALMVGAILAIASVRWPYARLGRRGRAATTVMGTLGAAVVVRMMLSVHDHDPALYAYGLPLFAVAAGAWVVSAHGGLWARLLGVRPLRWIGQISYGLYLWSWPMVVWLTPEVGVHGAALDGLRVSAAFAAATVSYYAVERPIRERRMRFRLGWTWTAAGAVGLASLIIAATAATAPPPAYLRTGRPSASRIVVQQARVPVSGSTTTLPATNLSAVPPSGAKPVRHPSRVLLLGDSVAYSMASALGQALTNHGITFASAAFPGCGVVGGDVADPETHGVESITAPCGAGIASHQEWAVTTTHPDLVVLFSGWESAPRLVGGVYYEPGTAPWTAELERLFDDTIQRVTAGGAKVALVLPPDPVSAGAVVVSRTSLDWMADLRGVLRSVRDRHSNMITLVDLARLVCPTEPCPQTVDHIDLRPTDGAHFSSAAGQQWVAAQLLPLIESIDLNHLQ